MTRRIPCVESPACTKDRFCLRARCLFMAEWRRPVPAEERPVCARLPTFTFGPHRLRTAVTLNRSQRSSTCRAWGFSAHSLHSPLLSKMA